MSGHVLADLFEWIAGQMHKNHAVGVVEIVTSDICILFTWLLVQQKSCAKRFYGGKCMLEVMRAVSYGFLVEKVKITVHS